TINRTIFIVRGPNTPLLRTHDQVPLSLVVVLDTMMYTLSDPFPYAYLPPVVTVTPLLFFHRMEEGGLLLRFVPHTRVAGCPRTAATRDGPVVMTGETERRTIFHFTLTLQYILILTLHI
ncbi:hypothetical protein EMCRGX_G011929, partial [Ephydatia muelleri]